MKSIELLSPAKDLECGKAAIDHGADAVYIGGPCFGARSAAGNSMKDIERLCCYAHLYRAKVYLTINTILFDNELEAARGLAYEAWDAGVDALIIQDMGLLELDLPPLPLIASTQMNNIDPGHINFLEKIGFQRAILARELSLNQIRKIRHATNIELEAFVHGSLCVCYSGRCYLSFAIGSRSANRGTCGQPCRLPWTLTDAHGNILEQGRHLLSLKDMDRSDYLEHLIDAGVTAFKIEGRLKDISYVKNITSYYRRKIDSIIDKRTDLKRASSGRTEICFAPNPSKTFSRGSTAYFLIDKRDSISSPDTPKSVGEEIGTVSRCGPNWFELTDTKQAINPGDGLCFFDEDRELRGLQVVKVTDGRIQVHLSLNGLQNGMKVFRNHEHLFLRQLHGKTSERRLGLHLVFKETPEGFVLEGTEENGIHASVNLTTEKELADKPEAAIDTIRKQLSRLNDTIYFLEDLKIETRPYFLRTSQLNQLRRELISSLELASGQSYKRLVRTPATETNIPYPITELDYSHNVSNTKAREFYAKHDVISIEPALELQTPQAGTKVMTTKHCIRRLLNACKVENPEKKLAEPLTIEYQSHCFRLAFDCKNCVMQIIMPTQDTTTR